MSYSAVLELFGALERGRLDPSMFHNTCEHFKACIYSIESARVNWFVDVDHVYAESDNEVALFDWVSMLCDSGVGQDSEAARLPWLLKGAILDGELGVTATSRGLTTSSHLGVLAELRTSLHSFRGIGVRVGYVPVANRAQKSVFSNVLWTGHKDIPYILFTDVKPRDSSKLGVSRLQELSELAIAVTRHSKTTARGYVAAITRILMNCRELDIAKAISTLAVARTVEGIELAGLVLVSRAYESKKWHSGVPDELVTFPRLGSLCRRLQANHAFPVGLVRKEAIARFLRESH